MVNSDIKAGSKTPTDCKRFNQCGAPLCPLDPELEQRVWRVGEEICSAHGHSKHRWIKKQRSIHNRQTKRWFNRPVTHQELFDASRPKKLTEATRNRMKENMKKANAARKK